LTHAIFVALSCSCYVWKWCRVARVAIPQGENLNFAKRTQYESAKEIILAVENDVARARKHKVILKNKANSSSSSRNKDLIYPL